MMAKKLLIIWISVGLFSAACGPIGPGTYRLATTSATPGAGYLAGLAGVLEGQVNSDGSACLWVEGESGARTNLIWPGGYAAVDKPLRVIDALGKTVATVGETVELQGGDSAGVQAEGCSSISKSWLVAKVISAK